VVANQAKSGQTVSAHIDSALSSRFKDVVKMDNRAPSQLIGVALKSFIDMSPAVRRVAFSIDGSASEQEQKFAAKIMGRSLLRAYQAIIESRHMPDKNTPQTTGTNSELTTEQEIENEAIRLCRA
jgi:hypothetical protein